MITAYASTQMAFQASKQGADSYVTKPWDNDKLLLEIRNTVDKSRLQIENIQLRRALKRYDLPNMVGKSEKMQKVMDLITQVAASRATVLITGESGTGKELVAKTIHATSPRADRPFVPVNTGSMPVDLLESTLFGHVKGAFTSAIATKRGLFEVANQGTIFFDEIGTVGVETQTKLLRVIQEREFMRPGRHRKHQGGRAHSRRHQFRFAQNGGGRKVPRGPVLPLERHHPHPAAAARPQGGYSPVGRTLSAEILHRK